MRLVVSQVLMSMRDLEICEIWINEEGSLFVKPRDSGISLEHIYRASASGTFWDENADAVRSPIPKEWSYGQWFCQIIADARSEYGYDLIPTSGTVWHNIESETKQSILVEWKKMPLQQESLIDDRTTARLVGDDRLREEARNHFLNKNWIAVVEKFEAVQYPQFLEPSDVKRLEIARKRKS